MIVQAKDAELYYTTRGQGPTCLVPSAIGTEPYERQLPAALDQHLRLAFVDLRGAGRSTGHAAELSFDVLADDLEAVRVALEVPRVAILGHSILGMLAIEYARRCPDRVSHAIVVGAPPVGDMALMRERQAAYFEANASPERKRVLQENMAALPPQPDPGMVLFAQTPMRFFDPRASAAPLFQGAIPRPEILGQLMGKLAPGWEVTAASPPLAVPLLVAHGRHDYVVPWVEWHPFLPRPRSGTWREVLVMGRRSGDGHGHGHVVRARKTEDVHGPRRITCTCTCSCTVHRPMTPKKDLPAFRRYGRRYG
jgi:proline iminopeptidase